jgi:hypothetical protein
MVQNDTQDIFPNGGLAKGGGDPGLIDLKIFFQSPEYLGTLTVEEILVIRTRKKLLWEHQYELKAWS